jgi:hypothetical protein
VIRVTVDLLPFGGEQGRKNLATFDIANDGTGTPDRGNYMYRPSPNKEWIPKVVTDYPRKAYNVKKLIYLVLKHVYTK